MPIKIIICAICGKEVSRRQSYLIDQKTGARACKEHEQTQQAKQQITETHHQEEIQRKQNEERKIQERRAHEFGTPEFNQRSNEIQNCCWKCLEPGLHHREFFMRRLIAMEKISQREGGRLVLPVPFNDKGLQDCKKVNSAMRDPISNKPLRYIGCWPIPQEKREETLSLIRLRFRPIAALSMMVQLCGECCEKVGYKVEDLMPRIDPDKFAEQMAFGELIHKNLESAIKLQAALEIEVENKESVRNN